MTTATWLALTFQAVGLLAAALCFYAALFLYEDEQSRLQSILDGYWINLHDLQRGAVSWNVAVAQWLGRTTTAFYDKWFGHLASLRAVTITSLLAIASYILVESFNSMSLHEPDASIGVYVGNAVFAFVAAWLGASLGMGWGLRLFGIAVAVGITVVVAYWWQLGVVTHMSPITPWYLSGCASGYYSFQAGLISRNPRLAIVGIISGVIPAALSWARWVRDHLAMMSCCRPGSDDQISMAVGDAVGGLVFLPAVLSMLVAIGVMRRTAKRLSAASTLGNVFTALMLNAFVLACLFAIPVALLQLAIVAAPRDDHYFYAITYALWNFAILTLAPALPSAVFAILGAIVAANRLVWPTLLRPLYSFIGGDLKSRRKLLTALGFFLLWASVPSMRGLLDKIIAGLKAGV